MAVSFRGLSLSAHPEGLSDVDKNSGEPENTYILRPIFQQRRVADVARRAMWGVGPGHLGARAALRRHGEGPGWGRDWAGLCIPRW